MTEAQIFMALLNTAAIDSVFIGIDIKIKALVGVDP